MIPSSHPKNKPGNAFSLEKYYVDLVSAEGQYFIGYSARLSWGAVKISYCAAVHDPSLSGIDSRPSLSSRNAPVDGDSIFAWRNPKLGFDGQWRRLASAERLLLLRTDEGVVDWKCIQPSAQVRLTTASGEVLRGLGYVECLYLTIPPWHLGLRTLFWGRFVSERHAIVWIAWRGQHELTLLLCNGRKATNPRISDYKISSEHFELSLSGTETIRDDSIANTLVSTVPSILRAAPIEFLFGKEKKYVSRGQLAFVDGSIHTGWVIHERVSWGQNPI